jgi:hypothetical protein
VSVSARRNTVIYRRIVEFLVNCAGPKIGYCTAFFSE